jgi:hypothetical protein
MAVGGTKWFMAEKRDFVENKFYSAIASVTQCRTTLTKWWTKVQCDSTEDRYDSSSGQV